ncbi:MAG: hypothetical protein H7251_11860 [Acetobacteraceae bacterium]|nr:hypothetical protein [Acetobacteraceae bacterium]
MWLAWLLLAIFWAAPGAARQFQVGADRAFKLPSDVARQVSDGDTVEIDPGEYYDCVNWRANRLTIAGRGAGVVITDVACSDKAAFVISGDAVHVRRIVFTRIRVADRNGAGIRAQGGDLNIADCQFINNEVGVLAAGVARARITVVDSVFDDNGRCTEGRCRAGLEVGAVAELRVERSRFNAPRGRVLLRSGAGRTLLSGNEFTAADPGGPLVSVAGDLLADTNRFVFGPNAQDPTAMALRSLWHSPIIALRGNWLENPTGRPGLLLANMSSADPDMADNHLGPGDAAASNVGLLNSRAHALGRIGVDAADRATAPARAQLRRLLRQ